MVPQAKAQIRRRRREPFAESYANELGRELRPSYIRVFGDPRRGRSTG